MSNSLYAVGFVFNNVKTYIKKDKLCKYILDYCQTCLINSNGIISPCQSCNNNSQYKICIFKVSNKNFISSSLGIATDKINAWEIFKKNIIYQKNGIFVISVTDECNKSHSFYANMIKAKKCSCCDALLLYFKYNIITFIPGNKIQNILIHPSDVNLLNYDYPYLVECASKSSNITFNLKSGNYKTIRFYNSQNYQFNNDYYDSNIL